MSLNQHEKDLDKLIRPAMMMGRVVSFWPLMRESGSLEKKCRFVHRIVMAFLLTTMSLAVTADALHNRDNTDEVTECGLISAAFYLALLRLIVISTHHHEMIFIVESIREDWRNASPEETDILKNKCGFSYKIATFFICTVASSMACFLLLPIVQIYLLDGDREQLPFRGYFFINHMESPIFEFVLLLNMAAGVLGCGTIAAATSFTLISVIHSAAKFSILREKLNNLKSNDPHGDQILKECVIQHQTSIHFAEELEKVISPLALGQFVISTGLLCLCGFQITSNKGDHEKLMKYCTFLPSAILELFLFSFSGHQLIEESSAVGDSAYSSDWVGSSFSKNLQIIMMRVKNPSKITAVKFYDLSLHSFSKVLSTSFSYFTVLKAVNE